MAADGRIKKNTVLQMYGTGFISNRGTTLKMFESFAEYSLQVFIRKLFPEVCDCLVRGYKFIGYVNLAAEWVDNIVFFQLLKHSRNPSAMSTPPSTYQLFTSILGTRRVNLYPTTPVFPKRLRVFRVYIQ